MSELELLFFDTFSHESNEEINLDLVQFPKPVFIGEVRVIPLGARVQADFPGGVRLGATNPSQFKIEFFVNDLSKPSASTFENLGSIDYNQNGNIHLECDHRHIPTDGLVLKGWYTTITLAVYGVLTKTIVTEPQVPLQHEQELATADWVQQHAQEDGGRGAYSDADSSTGQQFGGYPQGYPSQHGYSRHHYPWSQENYESKDSYEVESWDVRQSDKHWDRNKDRHQEQYRFDRSHEERSPEYRDRGTPEYDSRGRDGNYYRRDWDSWQGSSSRKRPHTPPPPPQIRPSPPPPESHQPLDESGTASGGGFESMSPGDVESISEGDIPETENCVSPSHGGGDDGAEPFEPILSDEEIADDGGEHQDMDYDFGEYSEDPLKSFNPYNNEVQPLQNLEDPALTPFEFQTRNGVKETQECAKSLLSLLKCSIEECKETWVENAEQVVNILSKTLPYVEDSCREDIFNKLMQWTIIGLDFNQALSHPQPAFKLRHIKVGVRLVESLAQCGKDACIRVVEEAKAQEHLLDLHQEEHMALSIKLMILKALDATLRFDSSIEQFIQIGKAECFSGYQRLVKLLEGKNHARVKYSICSIICKLHLYEQLIKLHSSVSDINKVNVDNEEIFEIISSILDNILQVFVDAPRMISQPKRFLPVSAQFEINNSFPDPYKAIYTYFRFSNILDDFISLLSHPTASCLPSILAPVNGIISELLESCDGLKFLLSTSNVNKLIRLLLGSPSSSENEIGRPGVNPTLGLHTAYRLQALSYLDALSCIPKSSDPDKPEILDILHGIFSLTLSNVGNIGKASVVHVLSQGSNMDILLELLKHKSATRKRSPSRGYICDLIILTVKLSTNMPFFQKYAENILSLIPDMSELSEIQLWLKPLENQNAFSYDNIAPLCEFVKNNISSCTSLPGDLVMAIRLLRHLGIPRYDKDLSPLPSNQEYVELKYKCVILQLYSLDGITHLTSILQKFSEYYEQPALHSASLIGRQGLMLLSFIHPAVQLLRRMLTYVIKVRNTDFKDLTAVPILLNIYNLMQAIPINAQAHTDALRVCREITETLLAYTQPICADTTSEADALNKSLWTSMITEVIKFCSNAPYYFIAGLMVFSELLPLPLPLQTRKPLSDEEASRFVSARKMWSAHLHSLNPMIESMIATIGVSNYQPLLQLLRRVCVQLADLAAPSSLMVVRTLLDSIYSQIQNDAKTSQLARLLNFLACLMTHGPVKAAFLSLIKGKEEKYTNLLTSLIDIFKSPSEGSVHCQEYITSIIQSLCDSEITLVPPSNLSHTVTNETFLANALPSKETLVTFCNAMLEHITSNEHALATVLPVMRTLVLLTEHDYTYYHLKTCLDRRPDSILFVLGKVSKEWSRESHECLATLEASLELCRGVYSSRGRSHLSELVLWKKEHPLHSIETSLKNSVLEDESLEPLLENVSALIKLLEEEAKQTDHKDLVEINLPPGEPLLSQFALRQVWVMVDADDDRLSTAYWLSPPNMHDVETPDAEQINLDLVEISKSEIPDLSLPDAVGRLSQACPTPGEIPAVRETKKRNVENAGTKRPFVAVMRGRGYRRGGAGGTGGTGSGGDVFRSRPPNTSRPPSLHVDDFVALETCGAQPTGPTGYNKASMRAAQDLMASRTRGRGRTFGVERGGGRFFGSPTTYHRESSGETIWGEMYLGSSITSGERRGGGAWPKDLRGVRTRSLRFFSR
ncbi:protein virilizer isoform X2 [Halyomorpha halys]|uniref:protein virilizer isoform X2 n=1 Tax=Halyomorpha halys TaxID=286706 RepID=UPI0006D4E2F9|nr:protein virilizer isoform X2 [Halyomorpha halys]